MAKGNPVCLTPIQKEQIAELVAAVKKRPSDKEASKHFDKSTLIAMFPDLASDKRDFRDGCFQAGLSFFPQQGNKKIQVRFSASDATKRCTRNPAEDKIKKIFTT